MKFGGLTLLLTAIVGAFLGCAMFMTVITLTGFSLFSNEMSDRPMVSLTPGMDILEDHRCPVGQNKILLVYGVEDGFSRAGDEPAIMRPELLELARYNDLYHERSHLVGFRNFDERGIDAFLITRIDFPPKIKSGIFVTRLEFLPGSATDVITVSDLASYAISPDMPINFGVKISDIRDGIIGQFKGDVATIDISDISSAPHAPDWDLSRFLKSTPIGTKLDLQIQDDTVVDFAGFSLCQNPLERKGTTYRSDSRDSVQPGMVSLSCQSDPNQSICDPYAGDLLCETEMPLGCYKDGNKPPPQGIDKLLRNYVGGDIRLTRPISGNLFSSLAEARAFCASNFGQGWRVLSFHEGGGSNILAHGSLQPKTRMWVDVKDKPLANCWTNGPEQRAENE